MKESINLLAGAEQIAAFTFEPPATKKTIRRARHWIKMGWIPAFKCGDLWCAHPDKIRAAVAAMDSANATRDPGA